MSEGDVATKDVVLSATKAAAAPSRVDDFAIVIGVDDYPRFNALHGAVDDATKFHTWLCDKKGGGVDASRAWLVTSSAAQPPAAPAPEPRPDQDHVDDALEELLEAADAHGGGRRLYLYFSGHGATAKNAIANVAMLLADWSKKRANVGLDTSSYMDEIQSYGLFEELAVFLDCCRTDSSIIGRRITIALQPKLQPKLKTLSFIAYATELGDPAQERLTPQGWCGVFTETLLAILRRNPDGVPAGELKTYLESEVRLANKGQQARVVNALPDASIFGRGGTLPTLSVTFTEGRRGPVRVLDGFDKEVASHDPAVGAWSKPLRAGLYQLVDGNNQIQLVHHRETRTIAF